MSDTKSLFAEGTDVILRAVGAASGCAFIWNTEAQRLDLVRALGDPTDADHAACKTAWVLANLALMAGGAVPASPPVSDAGTGPLCVPICEGDDTLGVICLREKADGSPVGPDDAEAMARLGRMLGRLCLAASQREHFAKLALRIAHCGLIWPGSARGSGPAGGKSA